MRVASPKKMGLPARAFVTMLRLAPGGIQNRMWKWWYQKLARANDDRDFRFMNYGFEDGNGPDLEAEDEPNRMFIQLYSMNIRGVDLEGKQVLEVGSGRGGGASWIAKTHSPAKLTGVDFSAEAVSHCKRWYADQHNLEFIEGNAQELPLDNDTFDVVYNVESSHCYGDMGAFVEQAYRVLKPGGMFCWTDLRDAKTMATLPPLFQSKGFEIVESADVVQEVIKALDDINLMQSIKSLDYYSYYLRGFIFEKLDMFNEAVYQYHKSISLNSKYLNSYVKLGFMYQNNSL